MATLINGVVIKRFNTLLELYNYNSDRLGEEVYVLDTAGDNNSPGGYSIYKKNVGENNWDRIFDSISISTKLKELILDIDSFGNAVSLDEDIIEFSNATVLSTISENGNDVLIEDVIFSAGASNYPVKSSPNNIVVGQQYAGKKFRAICTVSNAVDKNTSFEDNPNLQLTKVNLELENVDNTSDIDKPISAAVQTALDLKQNIQNQNLDLDILIDETFSSSLSSTFNSSNDFLYLESNYKILHFVIKTTTYNSVVSIPTKNLDFSSIFEIGKYSTRYILITTPASSSSTLWSFSSGGIYMTSILVLGEKK